MPEVREVYVDRPGGASDVREVRVERRGGGVLSIVMFLLGAIAIAVVVLLLLDVHWTISWPAGHVDIGLRPPVATAATTPTPTPSTTY
jgi:hypothetical protein